jgi:type II secretory ATPase GspE/PulE/Tfp pilus assembly ATPase PilB-like protein
MKDIQTNLSKKDKDLSPAAINQEIQSEMLEDELKLKAENSGEKFGYVDLRKFPLNSDIFGLIDVEKLRAAMAVPYFRVGRKINLAVTDPSSVDTKSLIDELVGMEYEIDLSITSLASWNFLIEKIEEYQLEKQKEKEDMEVSEVVEEFAEEMATISDIAKEIKLSSVKDGMNRLLAGAVKLGASDIHFQPQEKEALIRFRIDGVLQRVSTLSKEIYDQVAQQIKYDGGMKINVDDLPQDGRYSFMLNDRKIDLRVSSIPSEFGDNIVIRILDSGKKFVSFEELGFAERHLEMLREAYKMRHGMILITGPTGSGKTTTMYSLLKEFNTPDRKIITLENPIEYHLHRIVQSQIVEDKGYTFDKALESVLRQDPDVVMVGEIRNKVVAKTALQAALTGHVVLSTIHTNSAIEAIPRLLNMEVDGFMVAPAVDLIVAQRLVRTVCPNCKKEEKVSDKTRVYLEKELKKIEEISGIKREVPEMLPVPIGCAVCNHTGYKRRMVIAEIIPLDEELKEMILENRSILELQNYVRSKGYLDLKQDGILKVIDKKTTLLEIERVVN